MKSQRTPTIPELIDQKVERYYEAHTDSERARIEREVEYIIKQANPAFQEKYLRHWRNSVRD